VIGNGDKDFRDVPGRLRDGQSVVDLVRVTESVSNNKYDGICW
jgi:GDP-mannose 6-dehydrogenase